jgi:hypothetical protein
MSGWSVRRFALAMLSEALLVSACAAVAPSGTVMPSPPAATPSAAASPATATEPPAAALASEGGDPVTGQLGTFTWGDGGSDSPWLPGSPIAVGAGEPMTVTIADGVGVATWSAKRVPAGSTDGSGARGLGTGGPPIAFAVPESGSWSVQVTVDFEDGLGSATYYWLVTVR